MKNQEQTKKVELTFTYWLSRDGQLSGEKVLPCEQTVTGEVEVPLSILKERFVISGSGEIYSKNLSPTSSDFKGLYFNSLQTIDQIYERFINYPAELKVTEIENNWSKDQYEFTKFLTNITAYFKGISTWINRDDECEKEINNLIKMYKDYLTEDQIKLFQKEVNRRKQAKEDKQKKIEEENSTKRKAEEAVVKDRENWIEKYGSERLKAMVERGYEYRLTYEKERGDKELPEFIYDSAGEKIEYSKRANPSEKALKLESKYLKKYPDAVIISWGYVREWDYEREEYIDHDGYGNSIESSEMIFINPTWSRQGFVAFVENL